MIDIKFYILLLILIIILVLILCITARNNIIIGGKYNNKHSNKHHIKHPNEHHIKQSNEHPIKHPIKQSDEHFKLQFEHISKLPKFVDNLLNDNLLNDDDSLIPIHTKKNINEYEVFLPLTKFLCKINNENKLYELSQYKIYKHYIDKFSHKGIFNKLSNNLRLFNEFKHFLLPELKYLKIENIKSLNSLNYDDLEVLTLYRKNNMKQPDMIYETKEIDVNTDKLSNTIKYDIIYILENNKNLLKVILLLKYLLKDTSLVIISIPFFNSYFMVDIITLLQYNFNSVQVIETENTSYNIICTNYLFKTDSDLQNFDSKNFDSKNFKKIFKKQNDNTVNILKILISTDNYNKNREFEINTNYRLIFKALNSEEEKIKFITFIQNNEKIKYLFIFNQLNIYFPLNLLLNKSDIDNFLKHNHFFKINIVKLLNLKSYDSVEGYKHIASINYKLMNPNDNVNDELYDLIENEGNEVLKITNLDKKLILHKQYLDTIPLSKFKELDNLLQTKNQLLNQLPPNQLSPNQKITFFKILEILEEYKFQDILKNNNKILCTEEISHNLNFFTKKHKLDFLETTNLETTNLETTNLETKNLEYTKYNLIITDDDNETKIYEHFLLSLLHLQNGGSLIINFLLPVSTPLSIFMIITLLEYFHRVDYFKSSFDKTKLEVYLICIDYKGLNNDTNKNTNKKEELFKVHELVKKNQFTQEYLDELEKNNYTNFYTYKKMYYFSTNKLITNVITEINKYLFLSQRRDGAPYGVNVV